MCWFIKKKRVYPGVYGEWLTEFNRLNNSFLNEQDVALFSSGALTDKKFSIDNFKRELSKFVSNQIKLFFDEFKQNVDNSLKDFNAQYITLVIRRNKLRYQNLLFVEKLTFLEDKFKREMASQINEKLKVFMTELSVYFHKLGKYVEDANCISTNIKRII